MAVFDDVKAILIEELAVKPEMVKPESKLIDDLGGDSLDVAEIMSALEDKFEISIPEDEALQVISVAEIVQFVEQRLQMKAADQP